MSLRLHARLCVALFVLSTAFPLVAGVLNSSNPPRWLGRADVAVAAILFGVVVVLASRAQSLVVDRHRLAALRTTQIIVGVIPALLLAYFLAGPRIDWTVLVI